jgi:hypothetical protein
VSTDRVATTSRGMKHLEGGWQANVESSEPGETRKEKKRREKDGNFIESEIKLFESATDYMSENNEIDLFEEYFEGEIPDQSTETLHTKTLSLYKDPKQRDVNSEKRVVSRISIIHEFPTRFAAAYSMPKFTKVPPNMALEVI